MTSSPECPSRQVFGQALIAFLHRTHLFYQAAANVPTFAWPGESPDWNRSIREEQGLKAVMNASMDEINAGITVLGGLPLSITDTESGYTMRCVAESWRGLDPDPDATGNLLWHIKGTPPEQVMSVTPDVIVQLWGEFSKS